MSTNTGSFPPTSGRRSYLPIQVSVDGPRGLAFFIGDSVPAGGGVPSSTTYGIKLSEVAAIVNTPQVAEALIPFMGEFTADIAYPFLVHTIGTTFRGAQREYDAMSAEEYKSFCRGDDTRFCLFPPHLTWTDSAGIRASIANYQRLDSSEIVSDIQASMRGDALPRRGRGRLHAGVWPVTSRLHPGELQSQGSVVTSVRVGNSDGGTSSGSTSPSDGPSPNRTAPSHQPGAENPIGLPTTLAAATPASSATLAARAGDFSRDPSASVAAETSTTLKTGPSDAAVPSLSQPSTKKTKTLERTFDMSTREGRKASREYKRQRKLDVALRRSTISNASGPSARLAISATTVPALEQIREQTKQERPQKRPPVPSSTGGPRVSSSSAAVSTPLAATTSSAMTESTPNLGNSKASLPTESSTADAPSSKRAKRDHSVAFPPRSRPGLGRPKDDNDYLSDNSDLGSAFAREPETFSDETNSDFETRSFDLKEREFKRLQSLIPEFKNTIVAITDKNTRHRLTWNLLTQAICVFDLPDHEGGYLGYLLESDLLTLFNDWLQHLAGVLGFFSDSQIAKCRLIGYQTDSTGLKFDFRRKLN